MSSAILPQQPTDTVVENVSMTCVGRSSMRMPWLEFVSGSVSGRDAAVAMGTIAKRLALRLATAAKGYRRLRCVGVKLVSFCVNDAHRALNDKRSVIA